MILSPTDVARVLGRSFTRDQAEVAAQVIAGLQGELEEHTGTHLEPGSYTETHPAASPVFLRERPVVSVDSLTLDGEVLDLGGIVVKSWGFEFTTQVFGTLRVTYTAGALKPVYRSLMLGAAARIMASVVGDNVGLASLSVDGGTRMDFAGKGEWGFLPSELAKVKARRKVGIA